MVQTNYRGRLPWNCWKLSVNIHRGHINKAEPLGKSNSYQSQSGRRAKTFLPARKAFNDILCSSFNEEKLSSSNRIDIITVHKLVKELPPLLELHSQVPHVVGTHKTTPVAASKPSSGATPLTTLVFAQTPTWSLSRHNTKEMLSSHDQDCFRDEGMRAEIRVLVR